jgi:PAS domain S-box-containing protein
MKRILLVDDNEANLYMLRVLLQGHGYEVDEARDGAAALEAASKIRPDMIVSDLLMPVMDGFALLRRWKADERFKSAPFVVYTATYTDPRDERLALSLGADAFILKPAEPEPFMVRLELVLAKAERGEMPAAAPLPAAGTDLLEAQTEILSRKLEKKALELQRANAEVRDEMMDRRRAEDALMESEQRFRELAETVQEVFWMSDPEKTRILYVNPAYERLWGRTCASLYQSPESWVEAILPEDRERIRRASLTRQSTGQYDETFRIRRTDGTVRWIRDRAYPVRDAEGKVVRLVGTAEDITERRHLEDQFRQSQKMEAIGQLAAGVAHDFNNIIAVILGFAELAQAQLSKGRAAGESLEEIARASARAKSLVQQILTFSRQQPQERKNMPMGPTVEETVNFLRAVIPKDIEIGLEMDPKAPEVLADPTQIHQVIANLCTNAWHAMEDRGGRILVKLESVVLDAADAGRLAGMRPGPVARLTITDTGKGIDAAILDRIFDPFFTTKEPGKGTGLGLSVVQGIVQGHDGAIVVSSQPGLGTTIKVYLPAAVAAEPAPAPETLPGAGQRILYLDDEKPLVEMAVFFLQRQGFAVMGFTHAADALKAFRKEPDGFDLVITDMNMPGQSGLQFAAELLKLRPGLPIAICSGHVTDDLKSRARDAGIREVLYKPGTMEEFGESIQGLISKTLSA